MNKKALSILLVFVMISAYMIPVIAEDSGENLALGKTVWASDQFSAGYIPGNVNDGKLNTAWASGSTMLEGLSGKYCYIAIDLGQVYNITSFIARSRRDVNQDYNRANWIVQFSNDRNFQTFVEVGRKTDAGDFKSDLEINMEQAPQAYRYVRVAHESRGHMVISEIEVYGEPYMGDYRTEFTDVKGKLADSANLLNSLGIMGEMEKTKFLPAMLVSRMDALDIVLKSTANAIANEVDGEKLLYAEKTGIISSAAEFRPRDYITVQEFSKMMLCAMGYGDGLVWPGGVYKHANRMGWSSASSQNWTEYASRETIANTTYYALTSPVRKVSSFNNRVLETDKGNTLLQEAFGLLLYSGIVTANPATTLTEYLNESANYIEIDYKVYADSNRVLRQYIGRNVLFLMDEKDEKTIVDGFLYAARDSALTISMNDISDYASNKISYLTEDGKTKTVSLSDRCVFIKNGVAKADIYASDFQAENGTIDFIDNDRDDVIDTVYLHVPIIAAVDYCVDNGSAIDFKGVDGTSVKTAYDFIEYYRNGRRVLAEQMTRNALAYCYVSDNKKVIKIECSTNKIKGTVNGYSSEYININETEYELTKYFINHKLSEIKAGMTGVFLLDKSGRVVTFVDADDLFNGEKYGILLGYSRQGLASGQLRIFTQENEFVILNASSKLDFDGQTAQNTNISNYVGEIIIFKTNYLNEVTRVWTQHSPERRIIKYSEPVDTAWYYGNSVFASSAEKANMLFPVDEDLIVFTLPFVNDTVATGSNFESNYKAGTFANTFSKGNIGSLEYYNMDDFLTPQVVVKKIPSSDADVSMIGTASPEIYIFEGLGRAFQNGEDYYSLEVTNVLSGKKSKMLYPNENDYILMYDKMLVNQVQVFKGETRRVLTTDLSDYGKEHLSDYYMGISALKKGDIIRGEVKSGQTNEFAAVDRIFTPSDFAKTVCYISYGESAPNANASYKLRCGVLNKILNGKLQMLISEDGKYYTSNYGSAKKLIVIENNKNTVYSPRELPAYVNGLSKIVILSGEGIDNAIFIYNS